MKSALIVLLAFAAVNAEMICTPKSLYKKDCNMCRCSDDGQRALCTNMSCPDVKNDENVEKQICKPLSHFKRDCNTCFCSADGLKYACTFNLCPENKVESAKKQICKPQTLFKEYCNTCRCSKDGLTKFCTFMECDKKLYNEDGTLKVKITNLPSFVTKDKVCLPKTTFSPDGCNTCSCNAEGTDFICTKMTCDGIKVNTEEDIKITNLPSFVTKDKVCLPKTTFSPDGCNTCNCNAEGTDFICTKMTCDGIKVNTEEDIKITNLPSFVTKDKVCLPKTTFSPDGCNTCSCNADGTKYLCTKMICDGIKVNKKWGPVYKQGDSCKPGKFFYSECNICQCMENGKNARCTFMEC